MEQQIGLDASLDGLLGSRAFGQVAGFTQDFIAVTGRMASGTDGVYVIDTKNMVVVVLYYDSSKGKLLFGDVQSLRNTFGRVR